MESKCEQIDFCPHIFCVNLWKGRAFAKKHKNAVKKQYYSQNIPYCEQTYLLYYATKTTKCQGILHKITLICENFIKINYDYLQ